jgi:hypothetical protein
MLFIIPRTSNAVSPIWPSSERIYNQKSYSVITDPLRIRKYGFLLHLDATMSVRPGVL